MTEMTMPYTKAQMKDSWEAVWAEIGGDKNAINVDHARVFFEKLNGTMSSLIPEDLRKPFCEERF